MLTKVDLLGNIGRFKKLQHRAEPFRRLALLYARNGYGKTTICATLRSAASQSAGPINERAHLGGSPPSATLQTDPSGVVAFTNGSWNRHPPPLLIFDAEFVRTNVHAAEEVTRDNKRGLFQVIIGSTGVSLAQKIAELDTENSEVNTRLRTLEGSIKKAVPSVTDVSAFMAASLPDDIETRTKAAQRTLAVVERSSDVAQRAALSRVELGERAEEYLAVLSDSRGEAFSRSDAKVGEHLAKFDMDEDGRRWLRYGVDHVADESCPFCDQDLKESSVIEALTTVYGDVYRDLTESADNAAQVLEPLTQHDGHTSLARLIVRNSELAKFWGDFCELPQLPELPPSDVMAWQGCMSQVHAALKAKALHPSSRVSVTSYQRADWDALRVRVAEYNAAIDAANAKIAPVKAAENRPTPTDQATARERLGKYDALNRRDSEPLKSLCGEWSAKNARHAAIARERKAAQEALRNHTASMAKVYEKDVNALLEQFGTNFRLCQTQTTFKGGSKPNTEYCIDVNGHVLAAGDSKGGSAPSFRTVLSGGDKASLALALFIAQARQRADLADITLVFDDPFSSHDSVRQFETSARLRELSALARQVVVLSHDARFLHLIAKDAEPVLCSEHQIVMEGDWEGSVKAWSAVDELKAEYVRRAERIRAFASSGKHLRNCTPQALASDIRVFVEEYLDLRFPGRFAANVTLGIMVDEITGAGPGDPLHSHVMALRELNEFSRPEHHRGGGSPDPDQLKTQCQKVVRIVGAY